MLRLVTVCRPAKAFIFHSGHPDVCTAIIIIIIITIIIIIIITIIKIIKQFYTHHLYQAIWDDKF